MATFTGTNNPLTNPKQAQEKFKNLLRKKGGTYQAKSGDSWFRIAGEIYKDFFGGDEVQAQRMAQALAAANPDIANIRPGQRIRLPMPTRNPYVSAGFGGVGGANNQTGGASAPSTLPATQANPAAQPAGSSVQYPSEARYTAIANAQRANVVAGAQTLVVPKMPGPPAPTRVTPARNGPFPPPRQQPPAQTNRPFAMPEEMQPAYRPTAAQSQEEGRYTGNSNSQQARMGYNPAMRGRGYNQPARPPAQPYRPNFPAQTAEARQRASVPSVIGLPTATVVERLAAGDYPEAINMLDIPAIIPDGMWRNPAYVDAFMFAHGYKRSEYGFYVRLDATGNGSGGTNPYYTGFRGRGGSGGGRGGGGGGSYGGYGGGYGANADQLRYANESGLVTWRI